MAIALLLCAIAVIKYQTSAAKCDINEQWTVCPTHCSEYCPTSETRIKEEALCVTPEVCPEDSCQCLFNYRRLSNRTCIPTIQCPPVDCSGANEYFEACPPLCPTDDCSKAMAGEESCEFGRIGIVLECSPRCRCVKKFWRKNGVCVPYDQCFK